MKLGQLRYAIALSALSIAGPVLSGEAATAPVTHDTPVMMERMTTAEVRDAIRDGKTTVLIFNASTEATGPAIALGKHIIRAQYLGEHIARELGNALVAPVMPFAPTTDEARFPGTVNLSPDTFSRVNEDVAESMVNSGFRNIILMGDHDQNQPSLRVLADKLDEKHRAGGVRVFYSSAAYVQSNKEIDEYLKANGYPPSRHGGVSDTSLTWAVDPDYVRPGKLAVGEPVPAAGSPLSLGTLGFEGDARRSSPELGKKFLEWKIHNGAAEIRRLVGADQ
jgi:creatinine amidohydrolase/Fe(II)-dependent formamide hydrolase-like protein